jgi:hypothetical protein
VSAHCRCHCRACGGHFTSLEAFDAHHEGSGESLRPCFYPEDAELVELENGVCRVSDPTQPLIGVVVYSHERAQRARTAFGPTNGRQTAPARRKSGVPTA